LNEEANSKYEKGDGQSKGKIYFRIKYAEDDYDDFSYSTKKDIKIPMMTNEKAEFDNPSDTKLAFQVEIEDKKINHWGYLCYEKMCGWYLEATREGEQSPNGLRICFKNNTQILEHIESDRVLI